MVRRTALIWTLALIPLLGHSLAAYAAPGDPAAGSPSGSVYELPFEKARADAAPKGSGGTEGPVSSPATGGEEDEGSGSYYRSENNFGSSSEVPGASGAPDGTAAQGDSSAGSSGRSDSGGDGAGQSGDGADSGDDRSVTGTTASAEIADTGNTSTGGSIALLVGIGVVAAGIGIFAARGNRLRPQQ